MNQDLCTFEVHASFQISLTETEDRPGPMMLDAENGVLLIESGDGEQATFPLISESGESIVLGVRMMQSSSAWALQVGTATFLRAPLFVQHFPINESLFQTVLADDTDGGHIGIIDIRDLRMKWKIRYYLQHLPVTLTLANNYLVVSTLSRLASDQGPIWYEILPTPADE